MTFEDYIRFDNIPPPPIDLMIERGRDDPEVEIKFREWIIALDANVELSHDPKLKIIRNVWVARVFFRAGWNDDAFEAMNDALWQAENENKNEIKAKIIAEIHRMNEAYTHELANANIFQDLLS